MAAAIDALPQPPRINNTKHMPAKGHSCPKCGSQVPLERNIEDAQRRIRELEGQVEMLKEKATAAGMRFHH